MKNTVDAWLERIYGRNRTGIRWCGLVVEIALNFEKPPQPWRKLPRIYRPVGRIEGRNSVRYAIAGLHKLLQAILWWSWHRWALEGLLFEIGWMEGDHDEAPFYRSLRWGDPRRIIGSRIQKRLDAARAGRDYAVARAREEGFTAGAKLTAEQLEDLRRMVKTHDEAKQAYAAHAATFGALVSISLALPVPWAGEVDSYDEIVKAVVDVVEELDRYKKARAISAESTVGLGL